MNPWELPDLQGFASAIRQGDTLAVRACVDWLQDHEATLPDVLLWYAFPGGWDEPVAALEDDSLRPLLVEWCRVTEPDRWTEDVGQRWLLVKATNRWLEENAAGYLLGLVGGDQYPLSNLSVVVALSGSLSDAPLRVAGCPQRLLDLGRLAIRLAKRDVKQAVLSLFPEVLCRVEIVHLYDCWHISTGNGIHLSGNQEYPAHAWQDVPAPRLLGILDSGLTAMPIPASEVNQ